jgi:uncharacterized protein
MDEKFLEELKEKIKPFFDKTGSHSFNHTQRVYNLCIKIIKTEKVDEEVVKVAALLHDIARRKQDKGEVECHAEGGAEISEMILNEVGFPKEKIEKVCYAIKVHRYSRGEKPKTKEAAIIQDADRLDALGAITIARVFDYAGRKDRPMYDPKIKIGKYGHNIISGTSINHFYEKILKIKPETFHTKEAQKIAEKRYDFTREFVDRFLKEWDGKL